MTTQNNDSPGATDETAAARRVATYAHSASPKPRSVGLQEAALHSYTAAHPGWRIVATFSDIGSRRTALASALDAAARGDFDVLLVHRLDRLSRRVSDIGAILIALDRAAVALLDIAEQFDRANPGGEPLTPQAMARINAVDNAVVDPRPSARRASPRINDRARCRPVPNARRI